MLRCLYQPKIQFICKCCWKETSHTDTTSSQPDAVQACPLEMFLITTPLKKIHTFVILLWETSVYKTLKLSIQNWSNRTSKSQFGTTLKINTCLFMVLLEEKKLVGGEGPRQQ